MIWNWLGRNKTFTKCGKKLWKRGDLGEPTSFLDHVQLGCSQRECQISKDIVRQLPKYVSNPGFLPALWTILICVCGRYRSGWEKAKQSDMESSHERRWFGRTNIIPQSCLFGLHSKRTSSEQDFFNYLQKYYRINDFCRSYWETWYFMVLEQTFSCGNEMDKSLWQTIISFDLLHIHHTCEYKQYCYVGNTAQHCRLGLFPDSDFAGDLEDSKSTFRRNSVSFQRPNICANKLDVHETVFSFTQFYRSWNHFFGCRMKDGWKTRTWFMGGDRHGASREHASEWSSTERPVQIPNAKENPWKDWWSKQCWFSFFKRQFFS